MRFFVAGLLSSLLMSSLFLSSVAFGATDALDEVNATRARRGLSPFVRDTGLSVAASKAADSRAVYLCAGHTSNDFGFVPSGSQATAAGCAAWSDEWGWG